MTKHFIKQKPFSPRSSEFPAPASSSASSAPPDPEALEISLLNRLSVFETLRAYGGRFFHLSEHWQRLGWSCGGLGRALPWPVSETTAWIYEVLKESGWQDAIVRLSIHWKTEDSGTVLAMARPFSTHPAEWYANGVAMKTAVERRPDLKADNPQIKCSQYAGGILAFLGESEPRAHELLFLGNGGYVAEGTVSNIFVLKGKRVLTPSAGSGILSGVTRAFVIDLCLKRGLDVAETFFTRHEVYSADECFMTNTSSEILPVTSVDGRRIGTGKPGSVTRELAEDFKKFSAAEL